MPINYKKYPSNWKQIRQRILERDRDCCKFCGVPNYAYVDKNTREFNLPDEENTIRIVLTIMHLDHDTTNNDDTNLAAGCQRCHNRHDIKFRKSNARVTLENKKHLQRLF